MGERVPCVNARKFRIDSTVNASDSDERGRRGEQVMVEEQAVWRSRARPPAIAVSDGVLIAQSCHVTGEARTPAALTTAESATLLRRINGPILRCFRNGAMQSTYVRCQDLSLYKGSCSFFSAVVILS